MPPSLDDEERSHMHRRMGPAEVDSDDPAGDDVELLRVRSPGVPATKTPPIRSSRVCLGVTAALLAVGLLTHGLMAEWADAGELKLVTWNIAAINNNPFEYWITHEDAAYNQLMVDVEGFISKPGDRDVPVGQVFTPAMWAELKDLMAARGWEGISQVDALWTSDFSQRKIISGFMKNKALGEKRLASMPDRVTNTVNLAGGKVANRPTVINCFAGDMTTLPNWWREWKQFMFAQKLDLASGVSQPGAGLLQKIKHSKYPAITPEEEAISVPLQTLCQAIFDAILVHIVNTVSAGGKWQRLQQQMCDSLNRNKDERTLNILAQSYPEASVVFLQESATAFVKKVEEHDELGDRYIVAKSATLDAKRDQNSVLLLRRSFFNEDSLSDLTATVMQGFDNAVPVANGDLLLMAVEDVVGRKYLLASFHGDTNGLATLPVLAAVHKVALTKPDHALFFGLDANTYTVGSASKQGVAEFAAAFRASGYTSCWGDEPNQGATTFNARTYLQPQLQKAAKSDEKVEKGDKNPKDFILLPKAGFEVLHAHKDNTGERRFIEDMVFPTLKFPSDHGIVATSVAIK